MPIYAAFRSVPLFRSSSAPTLSDHPDSAPAPSGSLNELKLTLPLAVVERIEHLERRIGELEHVRGGSGPGAANSAERDPRSQDAQPNRPHEPQGRPGGPSRP